MNKKFVVSACLVGQPCRYDGRSNSCSEVIRLIEKGLAVPLGTTGWIAHAGAWGCREMWVSGERPY